MSELEKQIFNPHWPKGLKSQEVHQVLCDDKGRNGGSWLKVYLAPDGDVHLIMQDWETMPDGMPELMPTLRCRTYFGGGRNHRTHQALLWLARAIQLDNAEHEERQKLYEQNERNRIK